MRRACFAALAVVAAATVVTVTGAGAAPGTGTLVTVGSQGKPFSQNKQNEPAIAVDASHPAVLAAGANDNIDMELCNAGPDDDCPFTPGVGGSGVYFSFDSGASWMQPTYTGLSARGCTGLPGDSDPECTPTTGPIGTLPGYQAAGMVADGDPALAFGPKPDSRGHFSWSNGPRLYYATLTSPIPVKRADQPFKGFEAIAVSRLDGPSTGLTESIVSNQSSWKAPVVVSKQSSATFSDKEQIWADNASSSPFFGNVYVCWASFQGVPGKAQPLNIATSRDGGTTWRESQVTPAANNTSSPHGFGRSGCTVRTDSHGVAYAFAYQFGVGLPGSGFHILSTSSDGGKSWSKATPLFAAVDLCNAIELSIGRCVEDGIGGARDDLGPSPSVDIANGAPTGADATNEILDTWVDGGAGLNHEHVKATWSTDGGKTWSTPVNVESEGQRGYYSAPALSPNGTDAWIVYNAFTTPFRDDTTSTRGLIGVVKHADVASNGSIGAFTTMVTGVEGDPRGSSQNNLAAGFLGDYVYAVATPSYGAAVWNDVRNAADCPDIDEYRQDLHDEAVALGAPVAEPEEPAGAMAADKGKDQEGDEGAPDVQTVCSVNFGNTDIFGAAIPDPTP
jgi:hypothetical protein